ncbi:hypothetical protein ACLKA6_016602 [Drosophila palustris]
MNEMNLASVICLLEKLVLPTRAWSTPAPSRSLNPCHCGCTRANWQLMRDFWSFNEASMPVAMLQDTRDW